MPERMVAKLRRGLPLDDDDVRGLLGLSWDTRVIANGHDVYREGDRPNYIHLIIDGWAARYQLMPDGSRQITAVLLPGDFGDIDGAILKKTDHSMTALTPLHVAFIAPGMLDQLIGARARVAQALRWSSLVDEAILRAWLGNIGRRSATARVAHLFCELSERLGASGFDQGHQVPMPLTQVELGDALGLTAVHVNRVLKKLRAEGLIALARGALQIIDIAALRRIGGFSAGYLHMAAAPQPPIDHAAAN